MSWVPDADLLQSRLSSLGGGHLEPFVSEQDSEGIEDSRFVVDDQDETASDSCSILRHHLGGQEYGESGAGPRSGVDQHEAPVGLNRALNDGKPQPAPARTAGDEGLEQPLADLFGNTRPIVPYLKPNGVLQIRPVRNFALTGRRRR